MLLSDLGLTRKQVAEDRLLRDTYGPAGIAEAERDATANFATSPPVNCALDAISRGPSRST